MCEREYERMSESNCECASEDERECVCEREYERMSEGDRL